MPAEESKVDSQEPKTPGVADRVRTARKSAGQKLQEARETLTGASIERKVAEQSELYTQVLLGLHRDLQAQARTLDEQASRVRALEELVASLRDHKEKEPQATTSRLRLLKIPWWSSGKNPSRS